MFYVGDGKTQDAKVNGSKHSSYLICTDFFLNVILICYYDSQIF